MTIPTVLPHSVKGSCRLQAQARRAASRIPPPLILQGCRRAASAWQWARPLGVQYRSSPCWLPASLHCRLTAVMVEVSAGLDQPVVMNATRSAHSSPVPMPAPVTVRLACASSPPVNALSSNYWGEAGGGIGWDPREHFIVNWTDNLANLTRARQARNTPGRLLKIGTVRKSGSPPIQRGNIASYRIPHVGIAPHGVTALLLVHTAIASS
jgi:hypothetical protein